MKKPKRCFCLIRLLYPHSQTLHSKMKNTLLHRFGAILPHQRWEQHESSFIRCQLDKCDTLEEWNQQSILHLLTSDMKVTMQIDAETQRKTLGKVTFTLVFVMFHSTTLQGNTATAQTDCLFETIYLWVFPYPRSLRERLNQTWEMRSCFMYWFIVK